MKRLPIVPTIIVALAVAAMIGLGIWQLERRSWKEGLLRQYAANLDAPGIAFPRYPVGEQYLYRRATAFCLQPTDWQRRGGRSATGVSGYRLIARCRTGAEGPGFLAAMGVTTDPKLLPDWKGGHVSGTITAAPNDRPLIANLFRKAAPTELMLVADQPAPGLQPNAKPDPSEVPNNHLAYAVQWFIFAALAVVIYLLALRWRGKKAAPGGDKPAPPSPPTGEG